MHSSHRRVVAATLAVVLIATVAACSRSGSDNTTTGTGASGTSTPSASGPPMNGQFGTITSPVCAKAPSGSAGTVSAADVGATTGRNVEGLTDSTIRIGTISDVGYAGYPGLNQELYDASDVFASWCNALGGINGHKIQIDHLDAKLFDYQSVIQTACQQDFSLVGGGGVFDNTGQADRLACLLPDFPGYVVTPEARGSDLQVQATNGGSNGAVMFGLANYLTKTFPSSIQSVGYITANTGTTITNKDQYQEAGASLGWKTIYDTQYNATGEPTWLPFAQAIKDKGVKGLYFVGSAQPLAALVAALAQIDYKLDWIAGPQNMYDPALVKQAGASLSTNPVYINDATTPFTATDVPAIPQYEQLFDTYLPKGLKTASLGLNAFAAWLLFAQSAKACGNQVTRLCVYEHGIHTTAFDGGGLSGPVNPSTPQVPTNCFVPVKATPSGFSIIDFKPNHGPFNCSASNVFKLTGNYGSSVKFANGQGLDGLR